MRGYREIGERVGTIGLGGWGEGWGEGGRIPAGLIPLALLSPHSSPHSPLPQSFSSPHSTSI